MSEGKENADGERPFHGVADSLLKKPPEISLFGKRDPDELKKGRTSRKKKKRLPRMREEKSERQQHDGRCDDAYCAVLQRELEIDPSLK